MTQEMWLILGGVAVLSAIVCGFLAPSKGRPSSTWAFFGLVFGVFAVLALAFVGKRDPKPDEGRSNPRTVAILAVLVIAAGVLLVVMTR